LRFRSIWRDPKQHGARFLNLFICIAEPASFYGSTGSVRSRIEKKDDCFATKVLQRNVFSGLVRQSKVGGRIMDIHGSLSREIEIGSREFRDGGIEPVPVP
jgi:hypothetical protein